MSGYIKFGAGGGGSPPSFAPSDITGLVAWYDPSDLSTLFQNSDGTGAVSADGDPVGYIADKSGNGYHLIQATSGSRPTYKTSGGLHWLDFDGGDTLAGSIPTGTLGGNISKTLYWAGKRDSGGGQYVGYGTIGTGAMFTLYSDGTSRNVVQWGGLDVTDAATSTSDEMWSAIKNGNSLALRVNGASVIASADPGGAANITSTNFVIGDWPFSSAGSFDGRCYGLIVCTGVSPSQADAETWLGAKAGLTI